MKQCKDCRYFKKMEETQGECRKNPPTVAFTFDGSFVSVFPDVMNEESSCGEFRRRWFQ